MPDELVPLLLVRGSVRRPRSFSLADLRALPSECQVPDFRTIDPKRAGRAVPLGALLSLVEPMDDCRWLTLHASADDFHASIPLDAVRDRSYLIFALGDQPLPRTQGGPVRFYIRDFAACHRAEIDECANVKFVDCLEFSIERGADNRPRDEAEHARLHQAPGPLGEEHT